MLSFIPMEREHPEGTAETKERIFYGVQDWELTTSGWLFNPEVAARHAQRLNDVWLKNHESPIKVKFYATSHPSQLVKLARNLGLSRLIPPEITPGYIRDLKQRYPNLVLSDIHPEFNATLIEEVIRATIGEDLLPPKPGAKISDRLKLGLKHRVYQIFWSGICFGAASSHRGVNLAETLHQEYGNVGLSMHVNLIEYFARKGELKTIQENVAHLLVESERPYNLSPHLQRLRKQGVKGRQLVSDPQIIRKEVVRHHGLDGMVLGADHLVQFGQDPVEAYKATADVTRKIDVAGVSGTEVHTLLDPENRKGIAETERLLKALRDYPHPGRLSVAFDFNPLEMGRIPEENQFQILWRLFDWADKIQAGKDLSLEDLHSSIAVFLRGSRQKTALPQIERTPALTAFP